MSDLDVWELVIGSILLGLTTAAIALGLIVIDRWFRRHEDIDFQLAYTLATREPGITRAAWLWVLNRRSNARACGSAMPGLPHRAILGCAGERVGVVDGFAVIVPTGWIALDGTDKIVWKMADPMMLRPPRPATVWMVLQELELSEGGPNQIQLCGITPEGAQRAILAGDAMGATVDPDIGIAFPARVVGGPIPMQRTLIKFPPTTVDDVTYGAGLISQWIGEAAGGWVWAAAAISGEDPADTDTLETLLGRPSIRDDEMEL